MKRVLMLATTAAMIEQFNKDNISILLDMDCEVHMAGNFDVGNPISDERLCSFKLWLTERNCKWFDIPAVRKPTDIKNNGAALKRVIELINEYHYDFIHCHTPIGSIIGRIAAKKTKTRVMYTAHGFHFFKGAPLKNWLIYYPAEWLFSWFTDMLITINHEDYRIAKRHMHAKKVRFIPGVGVDVSGFNTCNVDRAKERAKLKIPEDAFLLLSVGELMARKNQAVVIEALHLLQNKNIYYLIVGQGELADEYKSTISEYGLSENIRLLGFRNDVSMLCKVADCFIHPSIREGLGIAPLEAMASGLPLISSDINGMKDYTANGKSGLCINPKSVEDVASAINKLYSEPDFARHCSEYNKKKVMKYDIRRSHREMTKIYKEFMAL